MKFIDEFYSEQIKEMIDSLRDALDEVISKRKELQTPDINLKNNTEAAKQEGNDMYMNLEITFKSGETITYKPGEWDDYSFTGSAVVVKKNSAWIGIYNFDNVFCVELEK